MRSLRGGAHSRPHCGFDSLIAGNFFQVLEGVTATQLNISEVIASRDNPFHLLERPKDYALGFCARVFPSQLVKAIDSE
jgi:hypothetical protein